MSNKIVKTYKFTAIIFLLIFNAGCVGLDKSSDMNMAPDYNRKSSGVIIPAKMMLADFNSGRKINKIGGKFDSWDKDPSDDSEYCIISFSSVHKVGEEGMSLYVEYDVDSDEPTYNGFWMKLQSADLRPYKYLVLHVKGDVEKGFTERIILEIKDAHGRSGRTMLPGITGNWREIYVPFTMLKGINDLSNIEEFVITFTSDKVYPKSGAIYIDNIYVSK